MGWHIVQKLIEQVGEQSTLIGKYWVTSFFVIRLLIVSAIAGSVWGGAQSDFVCNTLSPGCKNVCFNEFSPIALTRYWYLQILCAALPSIIFIVYTAHKMASVKKAIDIKKVLEKKTKEELKELKEKKKEEERRILEEQGMTAKPEETKDESDDEKPAGDGNIVATKLTDETPSKLFLAYFFMVISRLFVEIGFMVGQYYVYTFKFLMPELWQCQHWPCPNVVDCFVSRPKEKSVIICLFYVTGCIMVILNILELIHIAGKFPEAWKERGDDITKNIDEGPSFGGGHYRAWAPGVDYIETDLDGYPSAVGMPMLVPAHDHRRHRRRMGGRRNRYR